MIARSSDAELHELFWTARSSSLVTSDSDSSS